MASNCLYDLSITKRAFYCSHLSMVPTAFSAHACNWPITSKQYCYGCSFHLCFRLMGYTIVGYGRYRVTVPIQLVAMPLSHQISIIIIIHKLGIVLVKSTDHNYQEKWSPPAGSIFGWLDRPFSTD